MSGTGNSACNVVGACALTLLYTVHVPLTMSDMPIVPQLFAFCSMKALQCRVMIYICGRTIRSALSIDPTPKYFVTSCTHVVINSRSSCVILALTSHFYNLQAASHIAICHAVHTANLHCSLRL